MRLKLDENIGKRGVKLLLEAGHDVSTVFFQQLCSALDKELMEACVSEKRCLVTLDVDFGNPLLFRPPDYFGIAVLRLPTRPSPEDLREVNAPSSAALQMSPSRVSSGLSKRVESGSISQTRWLNE